MGYREGVVPVVVGRVTVSFLYHQDESEEEGAREGGGGREGTVVLVLQARPYLFHSTNSSGM